MTCLLPLMFLLNPDATLLMKVDWYKMPDPHVTRASELCKRRYGTCVAIVRIWPSGHIHVTCKSKRGGL